MKRQSKKAPGILEFVPDKFKTREMCEKAVEERPLRINVCA